MLSRTYARVGFTLVAAGTGGLGNGRHGDFWTECDFGPSPCTAGFRLFYFEA